MPKQVIYKNRALECIEDTMSDTYILKIQYQPVLQTQSMFKELMSFLKQYITIRTSKNKRVSLYFNTMNAHADNYMNIKEITDMINDFVSTSNSDLFACIIFLSFFSLFVFDFLNVTINFFCFTNDIFDSKNQFFRLKWFW